MDLIYHEKQEGSLCAQHCLNNLFQDSLFNAVDLSDIARQLDAEQGISASTNTSDNMDDSGYFSLHVIVKALESFNITLINYSDNTSEACSARETPLNEGAYICHLGNHWFTIRKIGQKWFDLNSTLSRPKLISDTHLVLYLAQLIQEGYHVFVVKGNIPSSPAEEQLLLNPPMFQPNEDLMTSNDSELQEALKISQQMDENEQRNKEDAEMQEAIIASLYQQPEIVSQEELRQRRLRYYK